MKLNTNQVKKYTISRCYIRYLPNQIKYFIKCSCQEKYLDKSYYQRIIKPINELSLAIIEKNFTHQVIMVNNIKYFYDFFYLFCNKYDNLFHLEKKISFILYTKFYKIIC